MNAYDRRQSRPIPAPYLISDATLLRIHQERAAQLQFALLMLRIGAGSAFVEAARQAGE